MKILILGAAGQIGRILTDYLLEQTNHLLVLYARNATKRLDNTNPDRIEIINGDFNDLDVLLPAMEGVDIVYVNEMRHKEHTATIIEAMKKTGVKRIIVASVLGIYDEVPGAFGRWNQQMVGSRVIQSHKESANVLETSDLDYTILRLTWLYNQDGNKDYMLTLKGEPFEGAQVTREAVAQLVVDIIADTTGKYIKTSLGVSEPDTDWDKPSFY